MCSKEHLTLRLWGPGRAPLHAEKTETARPVEPASKSEKPKQAGTDDFTEEEQRIVQDLKQRDQEVRAHEEVHTALGGPYAGTPKYELRTRPDGKRYAVGDEIQIDASPVRDNPEATVRKMDIVVRAALGPAEPGGKEPGPPDGGGPAALERRDALVAYEETGRRVTSDVISAIQAAQQQVSISA